MFVVDSLVVTLGIDARPNALAVEYANFCIFLTSGLQIVCQIGPAGPCLNAAFAKSPPPQFAQRIEFNGRISVRAARM